MRILLLQLLSYSSSAKGGPKANRLLLEQLVERGHACAAIVPFTCEDSPHFESTVRLRQSGLAFEEVDAGRIHATLNGVDMHGLETSFDPATLDFEKIMKMIETTVEIGRAFRPEVVLVSSDDFNSFMLDTAFRIREDRVVLLAHTISEIMDAFGPDTAYPDQRRHELLKRCAGRIAPSRYLASFMEEWGGLDTEVLSFPAYGHPPFRDLSSFDSGYITLISPSEQKGLPLFEVLTRALPDVEFAVVPSSMTAPKDRALLNALPNVSILPFSENIDDVFEQTRALLVPSLGYENFPLVIVEAMLRGIPVLASDCGGIPEAKLGVEYLLPINEVTIKQKEPPQVWDVTLPDQDPGPWAAAIRDLLGDRQRYEDVARRSREAAHEFLDRADVRHFEAYLERLSAASPDAGPGAAS
jgi:glycosyltransferase involved in cell wall biosynthesis